MDDYQVHMCNYMQELVTEAKEQTEELAEMRRHMKRIGDILDKMEVNL